MTHHPILIDPQDGPCHICAKHVEGQCDKCGKKIPVYENMGGNGYQSAKPSHFHLVPVVGIPGREARYSELCLKCYQENRKAAYGSAK